MCNSNENIILDLDFSATSDEVNWSSLSQNVIFTDNGKLILHSDGSRVGFTRSIGVLSPTNNRIRVQSNFEIENTGDSGSADMNLMYQILVGTTVIYEGCAPFTEIGKNTITGYFIDRTFKYESPIVAPITLKIIAPIGWQNKIYLSDLKVSDFNFCEDKVRTYFVVDKLLDDSLTALAGGMQLLEWKIDGVETLTNEFFNEVTIDGSTTSTAWSYAQAKLDGTVRNNSLKPYNTFNPFRREFGLQYDSNTWYGGLPTGTQTGSDYGQGILTLGFEKPEIINGNLDKKNGAFFIDIDYTKSLKVVFNVILNQDSNNLFFEPTTYREYTIEWNALTCEKKFCWKEKTGIRSQKQIRLTDIPADGCRNVLIDGFLSGLTGTVSSDLVFNQDTKISMYFDNSGSMGSTLIELTTMKDTLLKNRLLPFYNNDSALYDASVTITNVGGTTLLPSGVQGTIGQSDYIPASANERTHAMLNMLEQVPPNGNVVVFVFQDEATPIYQSGTFGGTRTVAHDFDLANLRARLNNFATGYYRGVIFQVVGNTIFPQLIQSIENGTPPYNGINGLSDRIEFGYNYNVTDGGTPTYYLDLIVAALQNLGYAV